MPQNTTVTTEYDFLDFVLPRDFFFKHLNGTNIAHLDFFLSQLLPPCCSGDVGTNCYSLFMLLSQTV